MKTSTCLRLSLSLLLLLAGGNLFALAPDAAVSEAKVKFYQGAYTEAMGLLAQSAAENKDSGSKSTLSDAYAFFALEEYSIKNYKNAYECFKDALKLTPTNQAATQGYLKLKREQDVNNLRNLGNRQPPVVVAEITNPVTSTSTESTPEVVTAPVKTTEDLQRVMDQLKAAEARLTTAESTVNTSKSESDFLKKQLEDQRLLVEKMITAQTSAPNKQISAQDSASVQKTLQLLSQIAAQNSQPSSPQVIVQPDPALQALLQKLDQESANSSEFKMTDLVSLVTLILLGLLLIGILLFVFLASRRNRRVAPMHERFQGESISFQMQNTAPAAPYQNERAKPALLDFVDQSGKSSAGKDLSLRSALVKADRLQKMYDEVRNGTISWDTVRSYLDELDTALKSEILKVVENKLETGDLISNEAVLPVLFPFLSDYDDFLRDKSQKLARLALTESSKEEGGDDNPLGVKALLLLANKLTETLKGRDRTLITAKLSRGVAKELGLSTKDCQTIYRGALAHDAGYLMIDADELQRIMAKPEITEEDFELIKSHATKGPSYFGDIELEPEILNAMLYHHERNDGSGYPDGLKKDQIPQIAKIIGVCETFATLIIARSSRDKMEADHALAIIKDGARMKFDRDIVDALVKVVNTSGGL